MPRASRRQSIDLDFLSADEAEATKRLCEALINQARALGLDRVRTLQFLAWFVGHLCALETRLPDGPQAPLSAARQALNEGFEVTTKAPSFKSVWQRPKGQA